MNSLPTGKSWINLSIMKYKMGVSTMVSQWESMLVKLNSLWCMVILACSDTGCQL